MIKEIDFGNVSKNGIGQEIEFGMCVCVCVRDELLLPRLGLLFMVEVHFNFRVGVVILFLPPCLEVRGISEVVSINISRRKTE
jgi:hypothetical protein